MKTGTRELKYARPAKFLGYEAEISRAVGWPAPLTKSHIVTNKRIYLSDNPLAKSSTSWLRARNGSELFATRFNSVCKSCVCILGRARKLKEQPVDTPTLQRQSPLLILPLTAGGVRKIGRGPDEGLLRQFASPTPTVKHHDSTQADQGVA